MIHRKKGLLILLLLILAGCSDLSSSSTQSPPVTTATLAPLASATSNPTQPAAGGVAQQPTVTDTTGAITGILVDETGQPIVSIGVFLANLSPGPTDGTHIISFSIEESKRGITDEQGHFIINDVAANTYSLAIFLPSQTSLIPEPGKGEGSAIEVKVQPKQVTDVGTVKIKRPK
jgi:hypothetical protein